MPEATLPPAADPVVLVVDDLTIIRDLLDASLRCNGFDVRLAGSGREAIDLFRQDPGAIAIVLLDVQMPGLDGPEVLGELQTIDPGVPAFFMTGDPGQYDEDDLLATGARRVFAKPLDMAVMAAEFRRVLVPSSLGVRS